MSSKLKALIKAQLLQGTTPSKLALTLALGAAMGIFPIWGVAAPICFALGCVLKLNHPLMQLVNALMYFIYFPLLPFFIRLGERIAGAQPVSFSIAHFINRIAQGPSAFIEHYGIAGLHGMLGWLVTAPGMIAVLYFALLLILKRVRLPLPMGPAQ